MNCEPNSTREPIPVILTHLQRRKRIPLIIGAIEAGRLVENYAIPRRDHNKKTGYQRDASTARVNRLVTDLLKSRVDLPTAILLNLREYLPETHLREEGEHHLFCPDGARLFVVDGQHRVEALAQLVKLDADKWFKFRIPFSCMLGADEREEMEQFYVVNSTAKSVRTDLAYDLLKERAETDPTIMASLIERDEDWKVKAQWLVEELGKTPMWKHKIRFPVQPKADTLIRSSGLVSSIKPLLKTPYFGQIPQDKQLQVISAYWEGIRAALPTAFNEPAKYVLQKTTGVSVMHSFLISLLEYVRSKGLSVIEHESYIQPIKHVLMNLEGDTSTGGPVHGADFWRSGSTGAAGAYSSNVARRVLLAKLRALLPEIEVE